MNITNGHDLLAAFGIKNWSALRKMLGRKTKNTIWMAPEYKAAHNENFQRKFTAILEMQDNGIITVGEITKEDAVIVLRNIPAPVARYLCIESMDSNITGILPRTFHALRVGMNHLENVEDVGENRRKLTFKRLVQERVPAKAGVKLGNTDTGNDVNIEETVWYPIEREKLYETMDSITNRVEATLKLREEQRLAAEAAADMAAQRRAEQARMSPIPYHATNWEVVPTFLDDSYANYRDSMMRTMITSNSIGPIMYDPARILINGAS